MFADAAAKPGCGGEGEVPIAIAIAVEQRASGSHDVPAGVVQGRSLGLPVPQVARVHSNTVPVDESQEVIQLPGAAIAEAFVYSPLMAKVFTGLDADTKGFLEIDVVEAALTKLCVTEFDPTAALKAFDTNGDGKIDLNEWEAGLTPDMRAAIERHFSADGSQAALLAL